jgi:hypothetical protein
MSYPPFFFRKGWNGDSGAISRLFSTLLSIFFSTRFSRNSLAQFPFSPCLKNKEKSSSLAAVYTVYLVYTVWD